MSPGTRLFRFSLARFGAAAFLVVAPLIIAGCSNGGGSNPNYDTNLGVSSSPRVVDLSQPVPKGGGIYKVGNPYQVAGQWYYPQHQPGYDEVGIASWYGTDFHGRRTSNGEIFDMTALTAAHKTLPLPSYAYVTNLQNGRTILVRINDRGPYVGDRMIDLSKSSAEAVGFARTGLMQVRVRYAGEAPINGDDQRERRYLAGQPWANPNLRYAERAPAPIPRVPEPVRATRQGWTPFAYRSGLVSSR